MATTEDEKPGLLPGAALVVANLALWCALEAVMYATGLTALAATAGALSAASASWAAVAAVAAGGTGFALLGPLSRPWSPSRTWLTMLTALAWNLGVILVLLPP